MTAILNRRQLQMIGVIRPNSRLAHPIYESMLLPLKLFKLYWAFDFHLYESTARVILIHLAFKLLEFYLFIFNLGQFSNLAWLLIYLGWWGFLCFLIHCLSKPVLYTCEWLILPFALLWAYLLLEVAIIAISLCLNGDRETSLDVMFLGVKVYSFFYLGKHSFFYISVRISKFNLFLLGSKHRLRQMKER